MSSGDGVTGSPGAQASSTHAFETFSPARAPLRRKLFILLAVGLATMFIGSYLVATRIVLEGFRVVEEQDTTEHVGRALDALRATLNELNNSAGDWANWTETYQFIDTARRQFVRDNLDTPTSFIQLRLNAMVFVHRSGRRVLARVYNAQQERYVPPPADLLEALAPPSVLLIHAGAEEGSTGVLMLSQGPMLVASRPILTSEGTGPARGTLVFGRFLDDQAIGRLSAQVRLKLTLRRAGETAPPADFRQATPMLLSGTRAVVHPRGDGLVSGYALINDVYGKPALIMRVDIPRAIYKQGRVTAVYFVLALMGLGCLLAVVLFILAERLILAQMARQEGEDRHRAVIQQTAEGIMLLDDTGRYVLEANPAVQRLLGVDARPPCLLEEAAPELCRLVPDLTSAQGPAGQSPLREITYRRRDGQELNLEVAASAVHTHERRLLVCVVRDVTGRKASERALRESEERYALAARGANDGLWDWDLDTQQTYFSPRWKSMLGHAEGEIGGSIDEWFDRIHGDDRNHVTQTLLRHVQGESPHFECEFRVRHRDGSYRWMLARGVAVFNGDGSASRVAGSMTDITARKKAEEQLLHDALHDGLTGLPNRTLFADRLRQGLLRMTRSPERRFGVLFIDVDRFKVVNDSLGHLVGDQLLVALGQRLEDTLRPADTVARLGGDEFAVMVEDLASAGDIDAVIGRLEPPLKAPYALEGRQLYVTVSIGSVFCEDAGKRPEELLRDADTALYRAKALGRNRHVAFDPSMHERAMKVLRLESDLRGALERHELLLHYQPIVSLSTGALQGVEALLRWRHPDHGMVQPASFIPLAEETGLIIPIGRYVLDRACAQIRAWNVQFPADPPLFVSVNLSAKQLGQSRLVDEVAGVLRAYDLDPRALRLEITETAVMENFSNAATVIGVLREMGVGVAIDDFGSGYSSLSTLHRLPIDSLKIDPTFLRNTPGSGKEIPSLVKTILAMAKELELDVVAEGIEDRSHAVQLKALGCQYGQGFAFAEPLDPSRVAELLRRKHRFARAPQPGLRSTREALR